MANAIEVENLSVCFKSGRAEVSALNDVGFEVEEGAIVGFLGPNGAGKTTTIHILLGFVEPTNGSARIYGVDVKDKIARQRIGYLPEHPNTYSFLKGRELLHTAGKLFGMRGSRLRERTEEVLKRVGLSEAADRRIVTYSRGMMQRIGVAQALINDPDLVLFDEPTGGLDPIGRVEMREIIAELRDQGKTVFFSSHELSEVERVCDRVILLSAGRIVVEGRIDELVEGYASLEQYFIDMVSDNRKGGNDG